MSDDTRQSQILALLDELRTAAREFGEDLPTSDPRCLFLSRTVKRANDSIRELSSYPVKGAGA